VHTLLYVYSVLSNILLLTINVPQAVSDSSDSSHDVTPSRSSSKVSTSNVSPCAMHSFSCVNLFDMHR